MVFRQGVVTWCFDLVLRYGVEHGVPALKLSGCTAFSLGVCYTKLTSEGCVQDALFEQHAGHEQAVKQELRRLKCCTQYSLSCAAELSCAISIMPRSKHFALFCILVVKGEMHVLTKCHQIC